MQLRLFRSAWGLSHLRSHPVRTLREVRAAGYDGVEASLIDIGGSAADRREFCAMAADEGMQLILSAYSSWPNYEGPVGALQPPRVHLARFRAELEAIAELHSARGAASAVVRINGHSGSDAWSEAEARDYLGAALEISANFGDALPPLSHETHRGRILSCPFLSARLLSALPTLRLTSDLSHWVIKAERMLDEADEQQLLADAIAPAVDHIHARIGTPQTPQVAKPTASSCAKSAERFYSFWEEVWSARETRSLSARASYMSATVEYGPVEHASSGEYCGYTPVNISGAPIAGIGLDGTLAVAAAELRRRFELWHARFGRRADI